MSNLRLGTTSLDTEIDYGDSQSILSKLFRKFLYKRTNADKMNGNSYLSSFNVMLQTYINRSGINRHIKGDSSIRGNLKKELLKPSMSWKTFIKGLRFLGVSKFKISITVYTKYGFEHTEEQMVVISDVDINDTDDDDS